MIEIIDELIKGLKTDIEIKPRVSAELIYSDNLSVILPKIEYNPFHIAQSFTENINKRTGKTISFAPPPFVEACESCQIIYRKNVYMRIISTYDITEDEDLYRIDILFRLER